MSQVIFYMGGRLILGITVISVACDILNPGPTKFQQHTENHQCFSRSSSSIWRKLLVAERMARLPGCLTKYLVDRSSLTKQALRHFSRQNAESRVCVIPTGHCMSICMCLSLG